MIEYDRLFSRQHAGGAGHEPPDRKYRSELQGAAAASRRCTVRIARRRGWPAQPLTPALSRSSAPGGEWKTGNDARIELRMKEAHLPRIKTLEEFDFRPVAAHPCRPHPRPGRRRLSRTRRTRFCWSATPGTGKKSHLPLASPSPPAVNAAGALYDCRLRCGQPTRRGAAGAEPEPMLARWSRVELIVID